MAKSQVKNRNKSHNKTKKRYGQIIEYSDNKQQDNVLLNYILNNPKSNLIVLFPTINLSSNLRTNLYDYLKDFGTIKAVKKIKLDYDGVVNLINHFYINQKKKSDIMEIKRKVMLDISWKMGEKKSIYVIIWQKRHKLSFKKVENKLKHFLMKSELNKVVDDELTEYVSHKKEVNISDKEHSYKIGHRMKSLEISDFVKLQSGGGSMKSIVSDRTYPLNTEDKTDEEVTLNFLTNIIVDKLYMCMSHDYYETVLFSKLLLNQKIIQKL